MRKSSDYLAYSLSFALEIGKRGVNESAKTRKL